MGAGVNVGVVGATGAVGRRMVSILEETGFPVGRLRLFASERSRGKAIPFRGRPVEVECLRPECFTPEINILLFSAGSGISREYAPIAAERGIYVVDNSSAWRMDPSVPLVVPEVNPGALSPEAKIIANPNCSTIQMVCALNPLHQAAGIERVFVATYQSVSGAGQKAIGELKAQVAALEGGRAPENEVFPYRIAYNLLPHIDAFLENGYTKEEMKMADETRKIMGEPGLRVSATCVRVPVFVSHAEAVTVDLKRDLPVSEAAAILSAAPGVVLMDDPSRLVYPLPTDAEGKDAVFVGRLRKDLSGERSLAMWVVADNLRKGAALNAVQIAGMLLKFIRTEG